MVIGIVIVAVYFASIFFYVRTLPDEADSTFEATPPNGVAVYVITNEVKFATDRLTADLEINLGDELSDTTGPVRVAAQEVTVTIGPILGKSEFTIAPGTPLPVIASTTLFITGAPYTYPFDTYQAVVQTAAQAMQEDGTRIEFPILTQMLVPEGFVGWRIQTLYPATQAGLDDVFAFVGEEAGPGEIQSRPTSLEGENWVALELRRAWSTVAISILILILMVLLTALSLLTSRAVQIGKKELNIGMAGWLAALLFAMPALRNLLPGAPPIGSWIDILIFFWVQIIVMISLASFVLYWLRKGPAPPSVEEPATESSKEPAEPP
jgi:hypothetical protein